MTKAFELKQMFAFVAATAAVLMACSSPETNLADMTIPLGVSQTLNSSLEVNSLIIEGALVCPDDPAANLSINANRIIVRSGGQFICGTATKPFLGQIRVTLKGAKILETNPNEQRSLYVLDGGMVSLHGKPSLSWTELAATAPKNTNVLELVDDPYNWAVRNLSKNYLIESKAYTLGR